MRKNTIFAMMAVSAIVTSTSGLAEVTADHNLALQRGSRSMSISDFQAKNYLKSTRAVASTRSTVPAPTGEEKMITDPEGVKSVFVRTGIAFGQDMFGGIYQQSSSGAASYVVTADDGKTVYISNIFSQAAPQGYVKGTREDDKVSIEFPQVVDYGYDNAGNMMPFFAAVMKYDAEGKTFLLDDDQTFVFNINENGEYVPAKENCMIGWAVYFTPDGYDTDYYWQGVGDIFDTFGELKEKPYVAPDDVEFSDWALVHNGEASPVLGAVKDNKVYIKNFLGFSFEGVEDATIVGDIKDGKVTFADGQYLGIDTWLMSTLYFRGGTPEYDEYGMVNAFASDDFKADYSENKIVGINSYIITHAPDAVDFELFVETPMFAKADPNAPAAAPAAPYNLRYDEGTADNPGNPVPYVSFTMPLYDANYNSIDYSNLYWELIVDSEPYVFTPEIYGVEEVMTTVPFEYMSDDWSILATGPEHFVDIRFSDYNKIGIRSVYKDEEVTLYSEIAWVPGTSVVDDVNSVETVSSTWYDLQGRELRSPKSGIMIRADRKADGTVKYTKAVVR